MYQEALAIANAPVAISSCVAPSWIEARWPPCATQSASAASQDSGTKQNAREPPAEAGCTTQEGHDGSLSKTPSQSSSARLQASGAPG
jgi:hypothetical protein